MRAESLFYSIQTGAIELGVDGLNPGYKADTSRLVASLLHSERDPALLYQFSYKTAKRIDEADNTLIERQFGITQADINKSEGDIRAADDLLFMERMQGAHINSRRIFVEIYYEDAGILFGYTIQADFGGAHQGKLADAEKLIITSYNGTFDVKTGKLTSAAVKPFQMRVEPNKFLKKEKSGKAKAALLARPMQGDMITYSRVTETAPTKALPLLISNAATPPLGISSNFAPKLSSALPTFSPATSTSVDIGKLAGFGNVAGNTTAKRAENRPSSVSKPFDDGEEAQLQAADLLHDHLINASINFYVLSRLIPVLGEEGEGLINETVIAAAANEKSAQTKKGPSQVRHMVIDLESMQDVTKARGSDIKRAHAEGRGFNFNGLIVVRAYTQGDGTKFRSHCKFSSKAENRAELVEVKKLLDPILARDDVDMEEVAQFLNAWGNPRTRDRVLAQASTVTVVREAPARGKPRSQPTTGNTPEGSS